MPYCQNGNDIIFFNFKQRHIATAFAMDTKTNHQLANKRAICLRFAAGEWESSQCINRFVNIIARVFGTVFVLPIQKQIKALQVISRTVSKSN